MSSRFQTRAARDGWGELLNLINTALCSIGLFLQEMRVSCCLFQRSFAITRCIHFVTPIPAAACLYSRLTIRAPQDRCREIRFAPPISKWDTLSAKRPSKWRSPTESLHRMGVALVKKAAAGFEAANLTGKTAAMPGGGQNALQSDLRYRPRTENWCFIPDFPALSTSWSESRRF
jgi:hypothetical protein